MVFNVWRVLIGNLDHVLGKSVNTLRNANDALFLMFKVWVKPSKSDRMTNLILE